MSQAFSLLAKTFCVVLLITICFGQSQASAGIFIDLDPGTAGIQSNLVLSPGVTHAVTADVYFDPSDGAIAGGFNTVGGDILWTNGGATVTPTSALLAGTLAQSASDIGGGLFLNNQLVAPAGTFAAAGALGTPLNSAALGVPLGFNGSLGGGGYADVNAGNWQLQANGSNVVHLLRANFNVTHGGGLSSQVVTFTPGGIIPTPGGTTTTAGGFVNGGAIFQMGNNNAPGAGTIGQAFNAATIRVVPEPTSLSLLGLVGLVALRGRRRRV